MPEKLQPLIAFFMAVASFIGLIYALIKNLIIRNEINDKLKEQDAKISENKSMIIAKCQEVDKRVSENAAQLISINQQINAIKIDIIKSIAEHQHYNDENYPNRKEVSAEFNRTNQNLDRTNQTIEKLSATIEKINEKLDGDKERELARLRNKHD